MSFTRSVRRRGVALAQLLLFAFSTSASWLPCDDASLAGRAGHHVAAVNDTLEAAPSDGATDHRAHLSVPDRSVADLSAHGEHAAPHPETAPDGEAPCPLMVGCAGIAPLTLDNAWRSAESRALDQAPQGVVLGGATADRDVDSPPPRS